MELKVLDTISFIAPEVWNSLLKEDDLFNEHGFLLALEKAKVENAITKYLCFFKEDKLIATSVVSVFYLNLALFIGSNGLVRSLQKIAARFFHIKVLFVGSPLSAGQSHLRISPVESIDEIMNVHIEWADAYCNENGIKHCIFKEFEEDETNLYSSIFRRNNYFKAYSIPTVKMSLNYNDYSDYLNSLRSGYRRQIKSSLKKAQIKDFKLKFDNYSAMSNGETCFLITDLEGFGVEKFHTLYKNVLDRAEVKLETLNQSFFKGLTSAECTPIQLLVMHSNSEELGVFAFAKKNNELTFIWTGKAVDKDKFDSYQNLLQALIYYGIASGCTGLILGQTAYYPKMRVGGIPEELYLFYKAQSGFTHFVLKHLNPIIFPKLKMKSLKVFKK